MGQAEKGNGPETGVTQVRLCYRLIMTTEQAKRLGEELARLFGLDPNNMTESSLINVGAIAMARVEEFREESGDK